MGMVKAISCRHYLGIYGIQEKLKFRVKIYKGKHVEKQYDGLNAQFHGFYYFNAIPKIV